MAKSDPKFVRLANLYTHGCVVDITDSGSGFGLYGFEVKPFPDDELDPEAAQFVRAKIQRGVIEEASEEEYTEQKEAADVLRKNHLQSLGERLGSDLANVQEATIQETVRKTQRSIINRRLNNREDELDAENNKSSRNKVPANQGSGD